MSIMYRHVSSLYIKKERIRKKNCYIPLRNVDNIAILYIMIFINYMSNKEIKSQMTQIMDLVHDKKT